MTYITKAEAMPRPFVLFVLFVLLVLFVLFILFLLFMLLILLILLVMVICLYCLCCLFYLPMPSSSSRALRASFFSLLNRSLRASRSLV